MDLNSMLSGGIGASVVAAVIWTVKLILDRAIPSRSDTRASVAMVLEGLNNMVAILQAEKTADAQRLQEKQERIEQLEESASKDYDRITELRKEVVDLTMRLAIKNEHIHTLVTELRKLGAQVTGLDLSERETNIEVIMPSGEVHVLPSEGGQSTVVGR